MPEVIRFETQGRRSLLRFLGPTTHAAFAKLVEVSQQTVSDWTLGKCRPNSLMRIVIERVTNGAIHRDAWLLAAERRRLRAA